MSSGRLRQFARSAVAAASIVVVMSCSPELPVAPQASAPESSAANAALLPAPATVQALLRNTPLAAPLTVSASIGVFGGSMAIPGAGLTVVVPPLALAKTTTIKVTALAGAAVAYEFAPHGIQFAVPLVVTQDLSTTQTSGILPSAFFAGYFRSASDVNTSTGLATITEILDMGINPGLQIGAFTVKHFSGYIIATGRNSGSADE
jgi:hypothetical protein